MGRQPAKDSGKSHAKGKPIVLLCDSLVLHESLPRKANEFVSHITLNNFISYLEYMLSSAGEIIY